ncbi:MAG TPA: low temperature requirement protein A [Nitrospirota bacterium]|nr:low temperature requirement protein A [Nitrospirota bacterium]
MMNLSGLFSAFRSSLLVLPRLRTPREGEERHATWLELFYDLVVVAAVASVAQALSKDHSASGILMFVGLFIPVFWVWAGHTVYATRFDTDDLVYRLLTFLQMFAVVGMAVEVHDASQGDTQAFSLAYLGARIILLLLLARADRHVPDARPFIRTYLKGFGVGAALWALSIPLAAPARYVLWGASLGLELAVPWQVWRSMHPTAAVSPSHIPERLGLFTIIVLGESISAVVRGLGGTHWEAAAIAVSALGFGSGVCVWWIYFLHLERAIGRVRLGSGQPYIYSHFPLLVGIVVMGTGVEHAISESGAGRFREGTFGLLWGGVYLWVLGAWILHHVMHPRKSPAALRYAVLLAVLVAANFASRFLSPLSAMVLLLCCLLFLLVEEERIHWTAARHGSSQD